MSLDYISVTSCENDLSTPNSERNKKSTTKQTKHEKPTKTRNTVRRDLWADAGDCDVGSTNKGARPRVTSGWPAKGRCPARRLNSFRVCFCCFPLCVCFLGGGWGRLKPFRFCFCCFLLCVCFLLGESFNL